MQNLDYELRCDNLITPQDSPGPAEVNTNAGMYRSMTGYRKGLVICTAHVTDGQTVACKLVCSTAAAAAGKADVVGKTLTLTGAAGALEQVGQIEFDVSELDLANSKVYVGVDMTPTQAGDDVAAVLVRSAARHYEGGSMAA